MSIPVMKGLITAILISLSVLPTGSAAQTKSQDNEEILHVLNRMTFGPRPGDVERVAGMGVEKFMEEQLHPERINDSAAEERLLSFKTLQMSNADLLDEYPRGQGRPQEILKELIGQKIVRAVYSERQLEEVMTDFWFNHFNIYFNKSADRYLTTSYERDVIRKHAFGKFEDLLVATATSPAMLFYLDNFQSVGPDSPAGKGETRRGRERFARPANDQNQPKRGLNENYARELMELHTLGVDGGYTQQDVTEVAKVFTG